jgi:hypothetical protein
MLVKMKNMKRKILLTLICLPLLIFGGMMAVDTAVRYWQGEYDPPCDPDGTAVVQVGDHFFAIPQSLRGAYIVDNGSMLVNLKDISKSRICSHGEILKRNKINISTSFPDKNKRGDPNFSAVISIRKVNETKDLIISDYFKRNMVLHKDFYQVLSTNPGTGAMADSHFFISADTKLKTPKGNALTFGCYLGVKDNGKECYTWFAWSQEIQINYKFFDGHHPKKKWSELHRKILHFIQSLEITPEQAKKIVQEGQHHD